MQYAMLGNQKCEAAPGLRGECQACQSPVLAKFGIQRVWHWAHLGKVTCNFEREPEKEWHRNWKNDFPVEWREVIRWAETGEKHIADEVHVTCFPPASPAKNAIDDQKNLTQYVFVF